MIVDHLPRQVAREPSKLSSTYSFQSDEYGDELALGREASNFCLDAEQVALEQEAEANRVGDVLGLPPGTAALLLRAHQWRADELIVSYLADPFKARQRAGLPGSSRVHAMDGEEDCDGIGVAAAQLSGPFECSICLGTHLADKAFAPRCGHRFCTGCWAAHARARISDGKGEVRCMEPGCAELIEPAAVSALVGAHDSARYVQLARERFVGEHPYLRWCPAPDCGRAIRVGSLGARDVQCSSCRHRFCFGCTQEAHAPLTCAQHAEWSHAVRAMGGTAQWLLENARGCPGCGVPVERSGGCHRMACPRCAHEFCWLCLGAWQTHDDCAPLLAPAAPARARSPAAVAPLVAPADGALLVSGAQPGAAEPRTRAPPTAEASVGADEHRTHCVLLFQYHAHAEALIAGLREPAAIPELPSGCERDTAAPTARRAAGTQGGRPRRAASMQGDGPLAARLDDAADALRACRAALKASCAFCYFLHRGPRLSLHEHLRAELESTVGELTALLARADEQDVSALAARTAQAVAQMHRLRDAMDDEHSGTHLLAPGLADKEEPPGVQSMRADVHGAILAPCTAPGESRFGERAATLPSSATAIAPSS